MRRVRLVVALVFSLGLAGSAAGQAPGAPSREREAVQERIRERFARLLRERVGLSEEQLRQLAPVSRRFEVRRQALFREERAARQTLRRDLTAENADQTRVAAQIDHLFALQRRRLDLASEEQRELAAFMTPVQRARYLALQELMRRRADEMRRRRGNGPARGGRRGAPGGPRPF